MADWKAVGRVAWMVVYSVDKMDHRWVVNLVEKWVGLMVDWRVDLLFEK